MKLSTRGRYTVMAMADLAQHNSDKPVSLRDIARRQGISLSYLEQLFSSLKRKNLVRSVRGSSGGYHLVNRADEITISDIIMAVDVSVSALGCKNGSEGCVGKEQCITHNLWVALTRQIHLWLSHITLDDVCHGKNQFGKFK